MTARFRSTKSVAQACEDEKEKEFGQAEIQVLLRESVERF